MWMARNMPPNMFTPFAVTPAALGLVLTPFRTSGNKIPDVCADRLVLGVGWAVSDVVLFVIVVGSYPLKNVTACTWAL